MPLKAPHSQGWYTCPHCRAYIEYTQGDSINAWSTLVWLVFGAVAYAVFRDINLALIYACFAIPEIVRYERSGGFQLP